MLLVHCVAMLCVQGGEAKFTMNFKLLFLSKSCVTCFKSLRMLMS